ncbi:AVAST type 3 anti-phage proein Avs3b [Rhizobium sp. 'Codium 1']|uniref:AVAST type 3 anti-phage proein Avs3b n=1 Tax=Rhizobium sp. 'Codium 1' TaxID=2940484 RepID=UPI003B640F70
MVEAMNVDGSADTLGRWMAHFVAELIDEAERTTGPEKAAAQDRCFTAILELWSHRAKFPRGMRPHQELEPILRVVESLDLATEYPRYYPSAQPSENDPQSAEVEKWLGLAQGLDYSAKLLIRYCLSQAADLATDKSKEWVKLAEAAEADAGVSEIFIRFISTAEDLDDEGKVHIALRKDLEDRLQRLNAFRGLAAGLEEHLQAEIEKLPQVDNVEKDEVHISLHTPPALPLSSLD